MPPFLPPPARALVPWARRYVVTTARRANVSVDDCWDEAVTALLRAAVYFKPGAGTFHRYARTAVLRGLWRYCRRPARARAMWSAPPMHAPAAETCAALRDVAQDSVADELDAAGSEVRRGRPPRRPFARAAACLAAEVDAPPFAPPAAPTQAGH